MDTTDFCILALFGLFVAFLIYFAIRRDRDWRQFAEERNGTFESGKLGSRPTVCIEHLGRKVQFSQPKTYGSQRGATEIQLEWPGPGSFEMELVPKLARFLLKRPGPEISMRGHALARSHVLYGSEPNQVQRHLTPVVLDSIVDLDALWPGCDGLKLSLTGGQLTFLKPGDCWSKTRLEELAESVTGTYTKLLEAAGMD
jgi:hypothetical protein